MSILTVICYPIIRSSVPFNLVTLCPEYTSLAVISRRLFKVSEANVGKVVYRRLSLIGMTQGSATNKALELEDFAECVLALYQI